jgi:thiamine biosynthesis lipoprotein
MLGDELAAIDAACSRFRPDSEIAVVNRSEGAPVRVSMLLFEAIRVACEVAEMTDGAVDPTVGAALEALGYDRDFDLVGESALSDGGSPQAHMRAGVPAPGWWRVELDSRRRTVRVPPGTRVDLGSSAKAWVADRAATHIAAALHTGVLVSVGGDVAAAGPAPTGGWAIGIAPDSSASPDHVDEVVSITGGGLASSSTQVRTWRHAGRRVHHIVDPATGECVDAPWTLVSAAARSCVEANAATTAAFVWGSQAEARLRRMRLPVRLARADGRVTRLNGWPSDELGATSHEGPVPS